MAEFEAGTILAGRYRLQQPIGRGGMAAVYRAHDTRLDRPVAVKILGARDRHAAEAAVREARLVASLSHPHLVDLYDSGITPDGWPFLVMRLVAGESAAGAAPLPLDRALTVGRDVAAGLVHAHARGIVHCDVKPQNILLDPARGAQLADFGVACPEDAPAEATVYGSASYIAPERLRGAPATPATDVYALGATLYHLIAGYPPFTGPNGADIAAQVLAGPPVPLRMLVADLPPAVDALVARAMARDPADRYPTAGALAAAIGIARRSVAAPPWAVLGLISGLVGAWWSGAVRLVGRLVRHRHSRDTGHFLAQEVAALRGHLDRAIAVAPRLTAGFALALLLVLIAVPLAATTGQRMRGQEVGAAAPAPATLDQPAGSIRPDAAPSGPPAAVPGGGSAPLPAAGVLPPIRAEAAISDPAPPRSARITVTGALRRGDTGIPGAPLRSVWHFRTGDAECRGTTTGPDGRASCTFAMSGATRGYPVAVDVIFEYEGQTYRAQVTFTPR